MTATSSTSSTGSSPADCAAVVTALRATFASGRTRDLTWRARQLQGLVDLIEQRREELVGAIGADLRRPPLPAAMLDLLQVKTEAQHALKNLHRWTRPERVATPVSAQPGRSWVLREPLGVVLVIAPWNYPVNLALSPLVAALAAGNCAVIKPSELTPACSAAMARLLPLHLDREAVAVVQGGAEVTQGLLAQGLDHCFFTGSPAVGRAVMAAAADHLTPVTLELGGKCPAVVTASARLDVAARRIAWGKVTNSGQTCVAPDHVLVEASVREQFLDHLGTALARFTEHQPLPILSTRHTERLATLLADAGGRTAFGGGVDAAARTAQATVVVDPDPSSALMQEEIFGPLLPVVSVQSLDQAVAHVRAGTRPLASYLFTEDAGEQERFLTEVSSGGTVINHVMLHLSVPELPFGGVGTSGTGRYHGHWGFETFSNPKAVLRQSSRVDLPFIYPPFRGLKKRLLERSL